MRRRRLIISTILVTCFSLLSCHPRGIVELSRVDVQRCDALVARDGELLIAVLSAIDDFLAKAPGSEQKLQEVRAQCGEHMQGWDQLMRDLYAKYGLNEETYSLNVLRGRFSRKVPGERTVGPVSSMVSSPILAQPAL